MSDPVLRAIQERFQVDVNHRGLKRRPEANLCNAFPDDFEATCASIVGHPSPSLAIVTGFLIPTAEPPAGETDGPLGAVYLARALIPLGVRVAILSDDFCMPALTAGLDECGLSEHCDLHTLPTYADAKLWTGGRWTAWLRDRIPLCSHLVAIERVGPSHRPDTVDESHRDEFLNEVAAADQDRCHTMRGRDITETMSPVAPLFEAALASSDLITIGIGDGGNEIGMGRLPWRLIRDDIQRGAAIACRIATHRLLVAGISNWAAYGLAAGIAHLRKRSLPAETCDPAVERRILERMVEAGLVDGVSNQSIASVDGLDFDRYALGLPR